MLAPTNPELQNEIETLERLYKLRDVVIPWMECNPHRVNLDLWHSECGTYACLFGNYCLLVMGISPLDFFAKTETIATDSVFGINDAENTNLFLSLREERPLSARKAYLTQTVIPRKESRRDALMRG